MNAQAKKTTQLHITNDGKTTLCGYDCSAWLIHQTPVEGEKIKRCGHCGNAGHVKIGQTFEDHTLKVAQ